MKQTQKRVFWWGVAVISFIAITIFLSQLPPSERSSVVGLDMGLETAVAPVDQEVPAGELSVVGKLGDYQVLRMVDRLENGHMVICYVVIGSSEGNSNTTSAVHCPVTFGAVSGW